MGETYPRFTVAAVQAAAVLFDREKTVTKAVRCIEEAADRRAVIIGFPETFIPGYCGLWYYAKKSNPLRNEGALFTEMVKNSVKVPSLTTDRLCQAAKKAHAYVVVGISELDNLYPGTLYMSQLFISDKGEIIGVHRKLVPTVVEKLIFSSGDGSSFRVYETPYGRLSAMNCGEHSHDLYRYALLAMGTQIHVASWPSFAANVYGQMTRDLWRSVVRSFAFTGRIFVVNACSVTDKQNIAACCDTREEADNIIENSGGGSAILGANGEFLAGPLDKGEGVLTAEISLEDALAPHQIINVLGHYTRWDVFSLNFNPERLSPFRKGPLPTDAADFAVTPRQPLTPPEE